MKSRILGLDPGSRLVGVAVLEANQPIYSSTLELGSKDPYEVRLKRLFEGLSKIIQTHQPTEMAIEKVFFAKNAVSALKLGQARGVALVVAQLHGIRIHEYSATEVKKAIVGHGRASKEQVAKMVSVLTGFQSFDTEDASDAMALALCHTRFGGLRSTRGVGSLAAALRHRIER